MNEAKVFVAARLLTIRWLFYKIKIKVVIKIYMYYVWLQLIMANVIEAGAI